MPRELHAPLEQALREGHLVPVCFVSARTGAGVAELIDVLVKLLPNPAEGNPPAVPARARATPRRVPLAAAPDPKRHVLAHVFKVAVDPFVGKLGVFRVHQGTVTRDSQLFVGDGRKPFKVGHLFMLQGKDHVEVRPGAAGRPRRRRQGRRDRASTRVLHDAAEDDHIHLRRSPFPVPVHGLAIEPKRRGDEQRMWEILHKLVDEDPCLKLEHVAGTTRRWSTASASCTCARCSSACARVYSFEVETRPPRIAYRETITAPAEGHHRHKKQSGGAGQFGEVYLRVEPLPRGGGFEFVDQVKGGTIPGQFIPAVEKGVREVLASGAICGHPVVDVRVIVYDGKYHSVDTKEVAFVTAGRKAFIDAIREARPIVLEPIVQRRDHGAAARLGDITGDLASRRGMVSGTGNGAARDACRCAARRRCRSCSATRAG